MGKIEDIENYYKKHANYTDFKQLGWESKKAQTKRFDVLLKSFKLQNKRILDVGCGVGDLYSYLEKSEIKVNYTGIDLQQNMVEMAKNAHPNVNFLAGDVFREALFEDESFDLIYASGIFNLNLGNNKSFLKNAIKKFLELSIEGFSFNLLHPDSPNRETLYYYIHPDEAYEIVVDVCTKSAVVEIVSGYLPNDYSVVVYKDAIS